MTPDHPARPGRHRVAALAVGVLALALLLSGLGAPATASASDSTPAADPAAEPAARPHGAGSKASHRQVRALLVQKLNEARADAGLPRVKVRNRCLTRHAQKQAERFAKRGYRGGRKAVPAKATKVARSCRLGRRASRLAFSTGSIADPHGLSATVEMMHAHLASELATYAAKDTLRRGIKRYGVASYDTGEGFFLVLYATG